MIERVCRHCRKTYRTFPSVKPLYCSNTCAGLAKRKGREVPCLQCGKPTWQHPSKARRYCSKPCAATARNLRVGPPPKMFGPANGMWRGGKAISGAGNGMFGRRRDLAPQWKGGRKVRKDGYVLVIAPDDHPHPSDVNKRTGLKYILEHRLVMEQKIGRYLLPTEVVHHVDGNPSNNDPSNLELFGSQGEHVRVGHGGQPTGRKRERAASS